MRVKGFTLIEVLFALSLGVVAVLLTLWLVQNAKILNEKIKAEEQEKYKVSFFLKNLESDFSSAQYIIAIDEYRFKCTRKGADEAVFYTFADSVFVRSFINLHDSVHIDNASVRKNKNSNLIQGLNLEIKYSGTYFPYYVEKKYSSVDLIYYKSETSTLD